MKNAFSFPFALYSIIFLSLLCSSFLSDFFLSVYHNLTKSLSFPFSSSLFLFTALSYPSLLLFDNLLNLLSFSILFFLFFPLSYYRVIISILSSSLRSISKNLFLFFSIPLIFIFLTFPSPFFHLLSFPLFSI